MRTCYTLRNKERFYVYAYTNLSCGVNLSQDLLPHSIYVTLELKERESCQLRVVDALGFRKRLVGQIMLALIVQAFA